MRPPLLGRASQHPTTNHAPSACPKYRFHFLRLSPGMLFFSSSNLSQSIRLLKVSLDVNQTWKKGDVPYNADMTTIYITFIIYFFLLFWGQSGASISLNLCLKLFPLTIFTTASSSQERILASFYTKTRSNQPQHKQFTI